MKGMKIFQIKQKKKLFFHLWIFLADISICMRGINPCNSLKCHQLNKDQIRNVS